MLRIYRIKAFATYKRLLWHRFHEPLLAYAMVVLRQNGVDAGIEHFISYCRYMEVARLASFLDVSYIGSLGVKNVA
jgi:hypothetical protein